MRARRRLPVIAGMALSAVVIAAPAAQADDFLSPRQDCSETFVRVDKNKKDDKKDEGLVGRVVDIVELQLTDVDSALVGGGKDKKDDNDDERDLDVRLPDRIMGDKIDVDVKDSFNCSNFFNRSFTVDEDDRHYNHHGYDHKDHGDRDHGDRDHGDRDHRDHGDRDHRGYGRTAPTAATAATAPTAPTAPTARVAR